VELSRHWRRHAGVGGAGPDNQLEEREEGAGGMATHSMTSSTTRGPRHLGNVMVHRAVLFRGGRLCD
jgi:hypothetical protein